MSGFGVGEGQTSSSGQASISVTASSLGSSLEQLLLADDITPGADPSYQLCKVIYLYHPLGAKMADGPISMAQSQERSIAIPSIIEDELRAAFKAEWRAQGIDRVIHNAAKTARIYGISAAVIGSVGVEPDQPLDLWALHKEDIYFSVLDPLNTAGSLVLNQNPNSPKYQKPVQVSANGTPYHRSRAVITMNEEPVYLAYISAAFGYSGRSVYQRALFPLKSFINTMRTDDMIALKAGLLVAKMKPPGSVIDRAMKTMLGIKRALLGQANTGNILTIGIEEDILTLNLQNIDGAGAFARTNILKNIATATPMPAKLLENETMVSGFGEGTEDAKNIAGYIDGVRQDMNPLYDFCDEIIQYRAWSPDFFESVREKHPEEYGDVDYKTAFFAWRNAFATKWPSLLREPESELAKVEDIKLKSAIAVAQVLMPVLDPETLARMVTWLADTVSENKILFPTPLVIDSDALLAHLQSQQRAAVGGGPGGAQGAPPGAGAEGAPLAEKEPPPPPPFSMRS